MKKNLLLVITILSGVISGCTGNKIESLSQVPIQNTNYVESSSAKTTKGNIVQNSYSEQQRQQVKLHTFYFDFYSKDSKPYNLSDTKNEHLSMLVKAEKRIDNAKLILDANSDDKVDFEEIKKFVSDKAYIDDFRNYFANFSFAKLDKNSDKSLSAQEFGFFNTEIKAKEVEDFKLNVELVTFDYNNDRSLVISEYEDFFIKYLIKKITWKK